MIDDLVGEGASTRMVSTVTFVDFLHDLPSLVQTKASQIRVGVETGIRILVQYVPKKYVPSGQVLEFPYLCSVIGKCPIF